MHCNTLHCVTARIRRGSRAAPRLWSIAQTLAPAPRSHQGFDLQISHRSYSIEFGSKEYRLNTMQIKVSINAMVTSGSVSVYQIFSHVIYNYKKKIRNFNNCAVYYQDHQKRVHLLLFFFFRRYEITAKVDIFS